MNQVFNALVKESQFTRDMLGLGATQIRNCNYSQKGRYFQAFTGLSTGMERIGKLCLMLDFYIHNGSFPNLDYVKRDIGHNIRKIYARSVDISRSRNMTFQFPIILDDDIHQNIITVLSTFAQGDRYSNIDVLVLNPKSGDPVRDWFNTVDLLIYDNHVSATKKAKIERNTQLAEMLLGASMLVRHTSETGSDITDVEEASYRTGVQEAVGPYRQLFVLHIVRFWVELLRELQYGAMGTGNEDIPYLNEIFAPFYNSDTYFKTRKTWDRM